MKKKIACGAVLLATAVFMSGCVGMVSPAANNVPINPVEIAKSTRIGDSCAQFILGMGPIGNMSIKDVLAQHKVSKVDLIEYEINNYVLVQKVCVIVYGH